MKGRRGGTLVLCLAVLGGLGAAPLAAQDSESDPRFVKDPRDVPDPRETPRDPREVELDPHAVPEGRELFEFLLTAGDDGRLRVAMVDNPWIVLGFIDETCNRRLVMTEAGSAAGETGRQLAQDLERQALHLATLADGGLRDSRFVPYVMARLEWTSEQIGRHRESEAAFALARTIYDEARSPQDLYRAFTPLEQSLQTARVLGDVGGQTRSMALMGRIHADLGQPGEAATMMDEVLRLGHPIRDFDSVWEALSVLYETAIDDERYLEARETLRDQYLVAQDTGDAAAADSVLRQLLSLEDFLRRRKQLPPGTGTTDRPAPPPPPEPSEG